MTFGVITGEVTVGEVTVGDVTVGEGLESDGGSVGATGASAQSYPRLGSNLP